MPDRMEFSFTNNRTLNQQESGKPIRILLMGNYSGGTGKVGSENHLPLISRKIVPVDVDNFESLLARFSPHLSLQLSKQTAPDIELDFNNLDDFHPDALFQRLELFQTLRELRRNLLHENTFEQAAAILRGFDETPSTDVDAEAVQAVETDENTFERLLGRKSVQLDTQNITGRTHTETEQLIRAIVSPHIVPTTNPLQQTYLDAVDASISTEMRQLLHDPEFQALESLWRSLHRLVTGLETGEDLQLYLLDVNQQELLADVCAVDSDLEKSAFYQLLVEQTVDVPGGEPWSAIVGDFSFGISEKDTQALEILGAIAARAGGVFLAAAALEVIGCDSIVNAPKPEDWQPLDEEAEQRWQALRASANAACIGLAIPRIMLRLPYGAATDEIDSFAFEEITGASVNHEHFLWGSPAFACAMLLASTLQKNAELLQSGDVLDLEDLPAYVFDDGEDKRLMPCAEVFLSERTGEEILKRGVMPLLSYRQRNQARLMRFQSIAEPLQALQVAWN